MQGGPLIKNLACYAALAIPLIGEVTSATADRAAMGDKAMAALRRAFDGGFHYLDAVRNDTDLNPIRVRQDFQLFLLDRSFPVDPFARTTRGER